VYNRSRSVRGVTKEISKVLQGLAQVGLTFRGLYGEGSEVVGNFFQLSNQTTLGKSETELLDHLGKMVRQVIDYEEQARQVLLRDAPTIIEDKVWRAFGLLRYARSLSFDEAMNLLSGVRLGVGVGLIAGVGMYTLNKLLVYTQPAHLAVAHGLRVAERHDRQPRTGDAQQREIVLPVHRDRLGFTRLRLCSPGHVHQDHHRLVGLQRFGNDVRIGRDQRSVVYGKAGAAKDEARIAQLLEGTYGNDGGLHARERFGQGGLHVRDPRGQQQEQRRRGGRLPPDGAKSPKEHRGDR